jgi:hypothetical protein
MLPKSSVRICRSLRVKAALRAARDRFLNSVKARFSRAWTLWRAPCAAFSARFRMTSRACARESLRFFFSARVSFLTFDADFEGVVLDLLTGIFGCFAEGFLWGRVQFFLGRARFLDAGVFFGRTGLEGVFFLT